MTHSPCNESRRRFLVSGGGLLAGAVILPLSQHAAAESVPMPQLPDLYTQIPQIGGEWNVVRLFFGFSCPFSRRWHESFIRWGKSLPDGMAFLPTPVVSVQDDESYTAALVFYTVLQVDSSKILQFMSQCYEAIQGRGLDPTDVRTYIMAASNAGVAIRPFAATLQKQSMVGMVERAGKVASRYRIKHTPSIGIHGRFLTSPEGVGGNEGLMFQLLNALVSKAVIDGSTGG